jgi:hypothetical protein
MLMQSTMSTRDASAACAAYAALVSGLKARPICSSCTRAARTTAGRSSHVS